MPAGSGRRQEVGPVLGQCPAHRRQSDRRSAKAVLQTVDVHPHHAMPRSDLGQVTLDVSGKRLRQRLRHDEVCRGERDPAVRRAAVMRDAAMSFPRVGIRESAVTRPVGRTAQRPR